MKLAQFLMFVLFLAAACNDSIPAPLDPSDSPDLALAAKTDKGVKGNKVSICHVDGQGRFHPISISEAAVPSHLSHGDNPLVGSWSGQWWIYSPSLEDFRPIGPMELQIREDCGGFEEGAYLAEVQYPSWCSGTWTFQQFNSENIQVLEIIDDNWGGCGIEGSLFLTYDLDTGELKAATPEGVYSRDQYGLLVRTQ